MKLYGFRPKSDEERELVERAMEGFPSIDAFVREAVLHYVKADVGPAAPGLIEAIGILEEEANRLRERIES